MEDLKKTESKNWKETAQDRRTWMDLSEKAKTHKGLQCQMMMMMISSNNSNNKRALNLLMYAFQ